MEPINTQELLVAFLTIIGSVMLFYASAGMYTYVDRYENKSCWEGDSEFDFHIVLMLLLIIASFILANLGIIFLVLALNLSSWCFPGLYILAFVGYTIYQFRKR